MPGIQDLQRRFSIPGKLTLEDVAGTPILRVASSRAKAAVALKGAQVLEFIPEDATDILWISEYSEIGGVKAIRGGVPVCWPWFGAHPADPDKPAHGFVRNELWDMQSATLKSNGDIEVVLSFETHPRHQALWPHSARLSLSVLIGAELTIVLETLNTGSTAFDLTQALHPYFRVGDVTRCDVTGLDDHVYLDKVDAFARKRQIGSIAFGHEVDRVYLAARSASTIEDPVLGRRLRIEKSRSASTVVWNPAAERAARIGDIGLDGWRPFVCVETANAGDDIIRLEPGERHGLRATYSVEPFA